MPLSGLLNLNKPSGMTSRRAVNLVERLARPAKAGHAGTLDPLATGVLVVCVGAATRLIKYVQRMPKHYRATFLLGRQSPTEDIEGDVTELPDAPVPTLEEIATAAGRLVGRIAQRPPAFSALKVAGRRAYKLAREGHSPSLPRLVEIFAAEVKSYEYPELVMEVECGSGTYIRSLGRDLAESLGTAAVMSALVRSAIGGFRVEEAVDPRQLGGDNWLDWLQPPLRAIEQLPRVQLSAEQVRRIRNGLPIERRGKAEGGRGDAEIAALDPAGQLVAILARLDSGQWRPLRNLSERETVEPER